MCIEEGECAEAGDGSLRRRRLLLSHTETHTNYTLPSLGGGRVEGIRQCPSRAMSYQEFCPYSGHKMCIGAAHEEEMCARILHVSRAGHSFHTVLGAACACIHNLHATYSISLFENKDGKKRPMAHINMYICFT